MLERDPVRDSAQDRANCDQTPVHAEIGTQEPPTDAKEQRTKGKHHGNHDQVGSNWPELSPLAGPRMNDKPIEQPRRERNHADDSENISNTIDHAVQPETCP